MILQCTRLMDHVTFHFNDNTPTAAAFMDIEETFNTAEHTNFLYKVIKLHFSASFSLIQKTEGFSWRRNKRLPREKYKQGCHKFLLSIILHILYINDAPQSSGVHLVPSADNTCIYLRDCREKAAAWPHFNGFVVWALKHKNQWGQHVDHILLADVDLLRLIFLWMDGTSHL